MTSVQRQGDTNSAGGAANGGIASVRINGRPVVVPGVPVTPHPPCGQRNQQPHCSASTQGGSDTVRASGQNIILTNDVDTCGHPRVGGSPDVRIG